MVDKDTIEEAYHEVLRSLFHELCTNKRLGRSNAEATFSMAYKSLQESYFFAKDTVISG